MNLVDLRKKIEEKFPVKDAEWDKVVVNARKFLVEVGVPEAQLEGQLLSKVFNYYKKQLTSDATNYKGIILGAGDATDFGIKKKYNEIKELWTNADEDIRENMISKGTIDNDGNPLWHPGITNLKWKYEDKDGNVKKPEFRRIIPEREMQRSCIGLFAEVKEDGKLDYRKAQIRLDGKGLDLTVPLFTKVNVRLGGKYNESKKMYYLNSTGVTDFEVDSTEKLTKDEYVGLITKYFPDGVHSINDEFYVSQLPTRNIFLTDVHVLDMEIGQFGNNKMTICPLGVMDEKDPSVITCFVPTEFAMLPTGICDVIVCGIIGEKDGKKSMNVMSIFTSFDFEMPKEINPDETMSEDVHDNVPVESVKDDAPNDAPEEWK